MSGGDEVLGITVVRDENPDIFGYAFSWFVCTSSMTDSTLRNFESDFRWPAEGGVLRATIGGETDRGGVDGEGAFAQSMDSEEYMLPFVVFGNHDAILSEVIASAESSSE